MTMIINLICSFIRLLKTIIRLFMNLFNREFQQIIKYGQNNYIEFYNGNMNLLISVPHDGTFMPHFITNRTSDKSNNLKRDLNTEKIANEIRNHLKVLFNSEGKVPFMIVNKLHRLKMDPNRDPELCCEMKSEASYTAYNEYHDFISNDFVEYFLKSNKFKNSLLIDLHGHNHSEKMIELGYMLSSNYLNKNGFIKNTINTSISNLALSSEYKLDELIRGEVSFGAILNNNISDVTVLPSPSMRAPGIGKYYSGGFIIERYGSRCEYNRNKPLISAIQVELPQFMRTDSNYSTYSLGIAKSIYEFYKVHNF